MMGQTGVRTPLTVTQLNTYLKARLEEDPRLASVFVVGEISNFTNHYRSGHLYFSLKDERSVLRCVMFARSAARLRFAPDDGMRVLARGRVSLYEASGQYQLYVEDLQPDGLGALSLAYEQLKARLEKEGLFAPERKQTLPRFPQRIGVITSPTGAAVHDILTILGRRWPLAEIVFSGVQVQGEGAAEQIARAVRRMNELNAADVLIVGRGGGSLEDLWAFNEEIVARAVASSRIPVISAVGHETDFTICDFAADLRAPTPSAAAELAAPDAMELMASLRYQRERLLSLITAKTASLEQRLDMLSSSRSLRDPLRMAAVRREKLDQLHDRLAAAAVRSLSERQNSLGALAGKLQALSPLSVLARGYAIAEKDGPKGRVPVSSVDRLACGDRFFLRFADGEAACHADEMIKWEEGGQKQDGSIETDV